MFHPATCHKTLGAMVSQAMPLPCALWRPSALGTDQPLRTNKRLSLKLTFNCCVDVEAQHSRRKREVSSKQ